jgi:hypothetical protein
MSAPEPPKRGINRNDCPMSQSPNSYLTASSQLLNALVHYVPGHPNFRSQKSQSSKTYFISCQTITNCRNLYTTNPHHTELPKHTANSAQTAIPTSISHNTAKLHVSISQSIRQPKSDVSNVPGPNQSSYHHWWISSKVSTKTTVLCLKVPTHIQQLQLNFLTSPCPMSQTSQVIKTHQFHTQTISNHRILHTTNPELAEFPERTANSVQSASIPQAHQTSCPKCLKSFSSCGRLRSKTWRIRKVEEIWEKIMPSHP